MRWQNDVSVGAWLRERLPGSLDVVPGGFEAYARILHPATRERPVGAAWPNDGDEAGWAALEGAEIDAEHTTWATAADAFGRTMHPLAQWHLLVGAPSPYGDGATPRDAAGWRYLDPETGSLHPGQLAHVAGVLARHTTSGQGHAGVWVGWGDLLGRRDAGGQAARYVGDQHTAMLEASRRSIFPRIFRRGAWVPGLLPNEVSAGPFLQLPGREHILFRCDLGEWADPSWPSRVPWAGEHPEWAHGPSLIWPDDRAWAVVSEIDFDSTIVCGSADLIRELVADPGIEALEIPGDAELSWEGDRINRPAE